MDQVTSQRLAEQAWKVYTCEAGPMRASFIAAVRQVLIAHDGGDVTDRRINYTTKQLQVMQAIQAFRIEHGLMPTLSELAEALGVTKPTINGHLQSLQKKGALRRVRYSARDIKILDPEFA